MLVSCCWLCCKWVSTMCVYYKLHTVVVSYSDGPPGTDVVSLISAFSEYCEYRCHNWRPLQPTLVTTASWRRQQMVWRMQQQVTAVVCLHRVGLANQRGGGASAAACGAFLCRLNPRQYPMFALSLERGCVNYSLVSCRECWPRCWWRGHLLASTIYWLSSWKRGSQLTSMFR